MWGAVSVTLVATAAACVGGRAVAVTLVATAAAVSRHLAWFRFGLNQNHSKSQLKRGVGVALTSAKYLGWAKYA